MPQAAPQTKKSFMVTESGIPHRIPLEGPTVFGFADGQVIIMHITRDNELFHPIYPDQSFLEVVRLREQARREQAPAAT